MLSAGQAVAEAAQDLVEGGPILVLVGPGNNGGDGFVAAAELAAQGREVSVSLICERDALKGDAASAAKGWKYPVLPFTPQAIGKPSLIIDALFGAGLSRTITGEAHDMIAAVNANGAPVVAVDLPSGINGTTAAVMGIAVRATETITFFRKKPAHLLLPGRLHCGRVRVADIGIDARVLDEIKPQAFENTPQFWRKGFPLPRPEAHKYARGHVLVASGDIAATGAARMAARGALRAGAGLVTLASPRDALAVNATALTAVMVRPVDTAVEFAEQLSDKRYNVCVIGPGAGIGERSRDFVHAALSAQRALVLDADALTSFAGNAEVLFGAIRSPCVLTPHEGEFARLFETAESKLERARRAAATSGAVMLLKGNDTVVAAPDGRALISEGAPPELATAGSGDVLAGIVTGLLAQGMPAFEAASAAVWLHGEAARRFGPGLVADDLVESLPLALAALKHGAGERGSV
jgi:hydroxyethylthiazole kinase-like uncharacterized protein yjeF